MRSAISGTSPGRVGDEDMNRLERAVKIFGGVAAVYGAFLLGGALSRHWSAIDVGAERETYRHYDLIELRARTRDLALMRAWKKTPPFAIVTRDGLLVTTVAGIRAVPLVWDARAAAFVGRWPCPWNAPDGEYRPAIFGQGPLQDRLRVRPFRIARRKTAAIGDRLAVLTWESVRPLDQLQVRAPDGTIKDWKGLLDWVQYVGADAFWMLGGQTPGQEAGEVWVRQNLDKIPEVAQECRRRGIRFGVYAMAYLTTSSTRRVSGYRYALELENGVLKATRAISIADPRRAQDVAAFLKKLRDIPGVDFLGLDYIRNALGGYELIDDFVREMPGVHPPREWAGLSLREKAIWFARKKIPRRDMEFVDAWQWWRAHKVAGIIQRIKAELGEQKPLWAFTLTWEKGWQHGQDPVMFCDAGIDADALMLYEATSAQFESIVRDWSAYVRRADAPLVVGDIVDWPLHQKGDRGAGELYDRLTRAVDRIHSDGPPAGLFIHDLERALHGRLGPHSTRQWMDEARRAIRYFKSRPPLQVPKIGAARRNG